MHLRVLGPRDRTNIALGDRALVVGRDPSCDVVLEDPEVAPRHLTIQHGASGAEFHDLGTPVFLDGAPVHQGVLVPGHALRVGATTLTLDVRDTAPTGPPAPPRAPARSRRRGALVAVLVALVLLSAAAFGFALWSRFGPGLKPTSSASASASSPATPASGMTRGIEPLTFDRNPFE